MKFVWLTDIHLNFLDADRRADFYTTVVKSCCDAVFISGDIAEAPSIEGILNEIVNQIRKPIYFVLGNHDYYRGQVGEVRDMLRLLTAAEKQLYWLPESGPQILSNNTVLLGQDGWADGRFGDYTNSRVTLNDSYLIADLFQQSLLGKYPLLEKMQQLADADAKLLHNDLTNSVNLHNPKKVIVLTHVPSFKEACLYEGKISNDDYLPYFSSKATGDVLLKFAKENPTTELLVLCGHTHSEACYQPLENLTVKAGKAEYSRPEVGDVRNL